MEKSRNYPQTPPQMNPNDASGSQFMAGPPSYEQATTQFPPVQVLPTPNVTNAPPPPPQQQGTQGFVGGNPSSPFVGVAVNPPRSYPTHQQMHPQVQQPVVIIQQQAVLPLGPESTYVSCPFCHAQSMTRISHEPSSKTHLMAAILCILGFWCCACIPYCADSCMNTNHYCGNCNKFLGTYADSL